MDLYAENILDHYRHPRGKVPVENPSVEHEEVNLSCGDMLKIQLNIRSGVVAGIGWDGTGCAISQAAMSMLAEELTGSPVKSAEQTSTKDIYNLLSVPIGLRRTKCALLCLHTLKNAIRKFKGEKLKGWIDTIGLPTEAVEPT